MKKPLVVITTLFIIGCASNDSSIAEQNQLCQEQATMLGLDCYEKQGGAADTTRSGELYDICMDLAYRATESCYLTR